MEVALVRDTDALYERAFAEHWRDVFQFLLAWTNDWAAAEDLSQETFLRLWRGRAKVDWREPVLPWLIVTGRRLATDRFRQIARRLGVLPSPASFDETTHVRWLDVQEALNDLSPLERSAVVLVSFQGMPTAEVARVLNTTPGGVRAALSRGREKLGDAR
jgi:RNA polymerase sigma-70 factor (ECF subfamily)